jgi:hypothetical protein
MMDIKENIPRALQDLYCFAKGEQDLESQLVLYQFVASCYWHNYSNTYSHKALEEDLIAVSESIIDFDLPNVTDDDHTLHVLTEAYSTGGHTRVVEHWIKSVPSSKHSVILNNHLAPVPDFLLTTLKHQGGSLIRNDRASLVEKARFLAKTASQFKSVILHHHPHDILPLLAFGTKKYARPTFFYQHADYVWGCGYSVCEAVLEIHHQGLLFSEKYRGIPKDKLFYLGIPLPIDVDKPPSDQEINPIIVTMAHANKFNPLNGISFQDFIDDLLNKHLTVSVSVIGVPANHPDWQELCFKQQGRVKLHGPLEKSKAQAIIGSAALYLNSFPLGSGTSMIEAISLNVPALSYKSPSSNLDSYVTYDSLQALMNKCLEVLDYSLDERQSFVNGTKREIVSHHSYESFNQRVKQLSLGSDRRDPIKINPLIVLDQYLKQYCDVLFEARKQNNLLFDYGLFRDFTYVTKQRICRIIAEHGLLYHSKMIDGDGNLLEALEAWQDFCKLQIGAKDIDLPKNEHCQKRPLNLNNKYVFDLLRYEKIKRLKFTPSEAPVRIKLDQVVLISTTGIKQPIFLVSHNGIESNGIIDFPRQAAWIKFIVPGEQVKQWQFIHFNVDIVPYSKGELSGILGRFGGFIVFLKIAKQKVKLLSKKVRKLLYLWQMLRV